MRTKSYQVICLIFDEFELLDLAAFAQILSLAGKHWNWRPFTLHLVARASSEVLSNSQVRVAVDGGLEDCPDAEILFIPGGYGARQLATAGVTRDWLARQAASAASVLSVAQGSLLLASALAEPTELALSSAHQTALEQIEPAAPVTAKPLPWLESGRFISASTSAATLDASLHLVQRLLGPKLASKVSFDLGLTQTVDVDSSLQTGKALLSVSATGKKP